MLESPGLALRKSGVPWIPLSIAFAPVLLLAVLLFGHAGSPALGDYAEWTYHGLLFRDVLQGHPDAAYLLKKYPVPNSLTTIGLGTLMLVLPWKVAAKVWLLVGAILGFFAAAFLQGSKPERQSWPMLVICGALLLGTTFWFGFTNFMFGTYFAMIVLALLLRGFESRWLYAVLLILTFLSHMIPWGFAVFVFSLYMFQHRRWRSLIQTLPSWLLCLLYFLGRALHGNADAKAGMIASVPYATPAFLLFKINSYFKCWGFVNPAFSNQDSVLLQVVGSKIFLLLFVLNAIVAVSVLVMLVTFAFRAIRHKNSAWFLWLALSVFFFVALLMPAAAAGISDPGARMLEVAVWCGVCLVVTRRRWTAVALGVCAVALLAANCWLMTSALMQPPRMGTLTGPFPARVRQFAHVYYGDRWEEYTAIEAGRRDLPIYPTAMFLKK